MDPLPATDTRTNRGTWVVCPEDVPAVTAGMLKALPTEEYDRHFLGQELMTAYFDDTDYTLRKTRKRRSTHGRYITVRVRHYVPHDGGERMYALSAKTESEKWRQEIADCVALGICSNTLPIENYLPGHLRARLAELEAGPLVNVVRVMCSRFAVEDDVDRLTLDVGVRTNRNKRLPFHVLEYKSTADDATIDRFDDDRLDLAPLKLSKFLWATEV
jgi:hypothetical protein